jgi:hypothetical protein
MEDITRIKAKMRFKPRSDTLENWTSKDPVLLAGEPGVVIDGTETEKIKFGDGVKSWNELGWWKGPQGSKGDKGEQGKQGERGEQGLQGPKGDTYSLTSQDKIEIADIVFKKFTDVAVDGQ